MSSRRSPRSDGAPATAHGPAGDPFQGYNPIRYTPCPDEFFDRQLADMDDDELRVTLYSFRRTFGFKKTDDAISISQYLHGIVTRDGRRLDSGCGLKTPRQVLSGLAKAEGRRTIFSAFFCKGCGARVPDDAMTAEERTQTLVNGERRTYAVRVVPDRCPGCDRRLRGFEEKRYFLNVLDDAALAEGRKAPAGGTVPQIDGWRGGSVIPTDPPAKPTSRATVGGYRPDSPPTSSPTETRNRASRTTRQDPASQEPGDRLPLGPSGVGTAADKRDADSTLWDEVRRRLRDEMTDRNFAAWIQPVLPLRGSGGDLVLGVRDASIADYLELRLAPTISRAAAAVAGEQVAVRIVVLPE